MNIEKSGIIEEQSLRKSYTLLFEITNKVSNLTFDNTMRFVYLASFIVFFALVVSHDQNKFFNLLWIPVFLLSIFIIILFYILYKTKKYQKNYIEEQIDYYNNSSNKNYNFIINNDFILNQFGDTETKYSIDFIKTCYIYKRNFIFSYKNNLGQIFSYDLFNEEEFEALHSFLKEKELLDTKYDTVKKNTSKS